MRCAKMRGWPRPALATRAEQRRTDRFARLDADKDGGLTLQEFLAPATQRFQAADANADGKVTSDELNALRAHRGRDQQGQ